MLRIRSAHLYLGVSLSENGEHFSAVAGLRKSFLTFENSVFITWKAVRSSDALSSISSSLPVV